MSTDELYEKYIKFPNLPVQLCEGSKLKVYSKEKSAFISHECLVDQLGMYLIISREDLYCYDIGLASDVRRDFIYKDIQLKEHIQESLKWNFTLVYGQSLGDSKYLHFVTDAEEELEIWTKTLTSLVRNKQLERPSVLFMWQREYYRLLAIAKCLGKLPVKIFVQNIVKQQNEEEILEYLISLDLIKKTDQQNIKIQNFTFESFYKFLTYYCQRSDLDNVFRIEFSKKMCAISEEKFQDFILRKQTTKNSSCKIARQPVGLYEPDQQFTKAGKIGQVGLSNYLMSPEGSAVDESFYKYELEGDNHPLPHYYIMSSHNTYLTGFQIYGYSSVEVYIQCLLRGCRCIEIDTWDGTGGEPIVTHGYAMCTNIFFKDVVEAIKNSAFIESDLPVIISIENHCSRKFEEKIVQYLKNILGDLLLTSPLAEYPIEPGKEFPPLVDLKNKVIIKTKVQTAKTQQKKKISSIDQTSINENTSASEITTEEDYEKSLNIYSLESNEDTEDIETNIRSLPELSLESETDLEVLENNFESFDEIVKYDEPLFEIVNYGRGEGIQVLEDTDDEKYHIKIISLSEVTAEKYINNDTDGIIRMCNKSIMRIYPKGSRIDSSNYNPTMFWNSGCQIVALNLQTHDLYSQLNFAIFEKNGSKGYVLKPQKLINFGEQYSSNANLDVVEQVIPWRITLKIISVQFLCENKNEIYASVETFGFPCDQYSNYVKQNKECGGNILFENKSIKLEKITHPENTIIRFCLFSKEDSCLYQRLFYVSALLPGYRYIWMKNRYNQASAMTSLFLSTEIDYHTPEDLIEFEENLLNPMAQDLSNLELNKGLNNNSQVNQLFSSQNIIHSPFNNPFSSSTAAGRLELLVSASNKNFEDFVHTKKEHKKSRIYSKRKKQSSNDEQSISSVDSRSDKFLRKFLKQRHRKEIKELKNQHSQEMRELMKKMAHNLITSKKEIKSEKCLNKNQKDERISTYTQSFISKCSEQKKNLLASQQESYRQLLDRHKVECELLNQKLSNNKSEEQT